MGTSKQGRTCKGPGPGSDPVPNWKSGGPCNHGAMQSRYATVAAHLQLPLEEEHQPPREGCALAQNGQRILSRHIACVHHHLQHLNAAPSIRANPYYQRAPYTQLCISCTIETYTQLFISCTIETACSIVLRATQEISAFTYNALGPAQFCTQRILRDVHCLFRKDPVSDGSW